MSSGRYLYETHLHTSEASACGGCSGADMARYYYAAGYTGIILTDHFFYGNTGVDRSLPWPEWVAGFCRGYESAKRAGDEIGLQVFFGWESSYQGTEFLVYGLDKQWLLEHPEIRDASVEEQYLLVHAGGGIISHAHPFREEWYIPEIRLFPEYVDAVEGINAAHSSLLAPCRNKPEYNQMALNYAAQYDLPLTAGSDQHQKEMLGGGMVFSRRLEDIHDFCRAVLKREAVELLDGTRPLPEKQRKTIKLNTELPPGR